MVKHIKHSCSLCSRRIGWGGQIAIGDLKYPVRSLPALRHPVILNTDQGSQFTSGTFTGLLKHRSIHISMDGYGAWRDYVFVVRLWKSVKYERVYLKTYESVSQAREGLARYFGSTTAAGRPRALTR